MAWQPWPGSGPPQPDPVSITQLIAAGSIDPELSALLWLLVEGRVSVVVAGRAPRVGKTTTLTALLDFLPPATRQIVLQGWAEDFDWLPEARELGWGSDDRPAAVSSGSSGRPSRDVSTAAGRPDSTYLIVHELSDHLPFYTWGLQARTVVRTLTIGYGMGATIHADSLDEVFSDLTSPEVGLTSDELSHLGVVLVLRAFRSSGLAERRWAHSGRQGGVEETAIVRRIVAAHYVRPVARDAHGHVQRLPPAALATWDSQADRFDHFDWGVTSELAARVGRRAGDFEQEQRRRAEYLAGLAESGVIGVQDVRAAIAGYRASASEPIEH